MKKINKFLTIMMALSICFAMLLASPIANLIVYALPFNGVDYGSEIKVSNIPSTGKIGERVYIPLGTSTNGEVEVVVKNPYGQVVTLGANYIEVREDITNNLLGYNLFPQYIGSYTIQYNIKQGTTDGYTYETKSSVYTLVISGTKPTMNFVNNDEHIMTDQMTIDGTDTIVLPYPVIQNGDGERVEYTPIRSRGEAEYIDSTLGVDEYVNIYAKNPEGNFVNLTKNNDGRIVFVPSKDEDENVIYGTYTITYVYEMNNLKASKSFTIYVDEDYTTNVSSKIEMNYTWKSGYTMPTSAVLGNPTQLPLVDATNKTTGEPLDVYTEVKVYFIPNGDLSNESAWIECPVDQNFKFTPMNKTENGGYYRVVYNIKNFYNVNNIENSIYSISNVSDTEKPEVYIVNNYTVGQDVDIENDLSYMIPNKIITNAYNALVLPAIYATDNFASVEEGSITLRRIWVNGSTETRLDVATNDVYNTNEAIVLNDEYLSQNTALNTVKTCLTVPGTYTIRYEAFDGVNTQREKTFTIVVVNKGTFVDSIAPRITMPTINPIADKGGVIDFDLPTAVDYVTDDLDEVDYNTKNCYVEVGYYYGNDFETFYNQFKAGNDVSTYDYAQIAKKKVDNKEYYSIQVPANLAVNKLYVVVRAADNAKYGDVNDLPDTAVNNYSAKYVEVRLLSTSEDAIAPTFDIDQIRNIEEVEYNQNTKISIPDFEFVDVDADFVIIGINVYGPNGKGETVRGASTIVNYTAGVPTSITLKNAWFNSSLYGKYTVVLTATDYAGNSTIESYKITVKDSELPYISVNYSQIPQSIKVGEEVYLPKCVMIDNGTEAENQIANEIVFSGEDNASFSFVAATNKLIAKEVGKISFYYIASDGVTEQVKSSLITIIVNKPDAPQFDKDYEWARTAKLTPVVIEGVETGNYEKVQLPLINYTLSSSYATLSKYTVTITAPNGEIIKTIDGISNLNENGYFEFEPTLKDGTYTITYKIVDSFDNSASLTEKIAVGDVVKPKITIANIDVNLPTQVKLNGSLKIAQSDITLYDSKDGNISFNDYVENTLEKKFVLTMKDVNGETQTLSAVDGYYNYDFNKAGTYTLTYALTDNAGNVATKVATIVVEGEGAVEVDVFSIWGTVLIIASVMLLAGVVVYFVLTNRKVKMNVEQQRPKDVE